MLLRVALLVVLQVASVPVLAQASAATAQVPIAPARSATEVTDFRVRDPALMALRTSALDAAEQALRQGNTDAAIAAFDRAAMMLHAADTEMGLVRAQLQAGEYRRALAFSAHTAGAHLDSPAASALYAWLLRAGGQDGYAQRVLAEALARSPDDAVLAAAMRQFERNSSLAAGLLLQSPHRLAPQALDTSEHAVPAGAHVVSSGVLIDDGRHALVPLSAVAGASRVWIRNGLGHTREAVLQPDHPEFANIGLALLRLSDPLAIPAAQGALVATRDPFAGSPGFAIRYDVSDDATPAWPRLHPGFFGNLDSSGTRKLGIDVPRGPQGGPLFDARGHLAGIAMSGVDGRNLMLPVSSFAAMLPGSAPTQTEPSTPTGPAAPMPADAVYEMALRTAVQVIALP